MNEKCRKIGRENLEKDQKKFRAFLGSFLKSPGVWLSVKRLFGWQTFWRSPLSLYWNYIFKVCIGISLYLKVRYQQKMSQSAGQQRISYTLYEFLVLQLEMIEHVKLHGYLKSAKLHLNLLNNDHAFPKYFATFSHILTNYTGRCIIFVLGKRNMASILTF